MQEQIIQLDGNKALTNKGRVFELKEKFKEAPIDGSRSVNLIPDGYDWVEIKAPMFQELEPEERV